MGAAVHVVLNLVLVLVLVLNLVLVLVLHVVLFLIGDDVAVILGRIFSHPQRNFFGFSGP